jgi:hypothetical protein
MNEGFSYFCVILLSSCTTQYNSSKLPGGGYAVAVATPLEPTDMMLGHVMFMACE